MKNITVAIDDEAYRAARIRAAELGTSISALVKAYLQGMAVPAPAEKPAKTKKAKKAKKAKLP